MVRSYAITGKKTKHLIQNEHFQGTHVGQNAFSLAALRHYDAVVSFKALFPGRSSNIRPEPRLYVSPRHEACDCTDRLSVARIDAIV